MGYHAICYRNDACYWFTQFPRLCHGGDDLKVCSLSFLPLGCISSHPLHSVIVTPLSIVGSLFPLHSCRITTFAHFRVRAPTTIFPSFEPLVAMDGPPVLSCAHSRPHSWRRGDNRMGPRGFQRSDPAVPSCSQCFTTPNSPELP